MHGMLAELPIVIVIISIKESQRIGTGGRPRHCRTIGSCQLAPAF